MDQDTSNSPGKVRWRERLGMGSSGKDLPKISDEFKPASDQPPRPAPPVTSKEAKVASSTTRAPQPVTRPAPMAPRNPPRAAQQAGGARPASPIPQGASGLGDRLRAERNAAEKLAEQRVAQARGNGNADGPLQPSSNQRAAMPVPERPKFTFSPEELAKDKREQTPPREREFPSFSSKPGLSTTPPPLTPPRPALGAAAAAQAQALVRPQPPKLPASGSSPAGTGFQPRYGSAPVQPSGGNYRSLDPPGGLGAKPKLFADTASYREDPLARRPVAREYDSYRRGPGLSPSPQPTYGEESGPSLGEYRRRASARGRRPAYDPDMNEVFEDEEPAPQRRRSSAQDYNRAERDYEDEYEVEAPRRRGPWLWLAAIAAVGLLAAGIIYYYLTYLKSPNTATGNLPVIEAPEQAPKTAPEPASGSTLGTQGAAQPGAVDQRKQIYDRILGDDEIGGTEVVPTQEQPQIVEPTESEPGPSTGDTANEPLPLPLPPPGDPQGSLLDEASQQTAALGEVNGVSAARHVSTDAVPVPGEMAGGAEPSTMQAPPQVEKVVNVPQPPSVETQKPAKPKLRTEKNPPKNVAAVEDPGVGQDDSVEPLILVPPAQTGVPQAQNVDAQNIQPQIAQPGVDQPQAETAAGQQKSKSFFSFGTGKLKATGKSAEREFAQGASGNWVNSPDPNSASAETPDTQQVASVAPEPLPAPEPVSPAPQPAPQQAQPAPQQAQPSSGGYVAQLASFRSEAEAMAEFDRLRAKHGPVLNGLSPRIVKATIAGGSRYRLGVGPLASRSAASKVCNSLIAAGERDCLVRSN